MRKRIEKINFATRTPGWRALASQTFKRASQASKGKSCVHFTREISSTPQKRYAFAVIARQHDREMGCLDGYSLQNCLEKVVLLPPPLVNHVDGLSHVLVRRKSVCVSNVANHRICEKLGCKAADLLGPCRSEEESLASLPAAQTNA